MERSDAASAVALLVAGLVVGASVGYLVAPDRNRGRPAATATATPGDGDGGRLDGRIVWVGGTVAGVDGDTILLNTSGDEPLKLRIEGGEVYRCRPDADGVTCDGGITFADVDPGARICVAVRPTNGTLEVTKGFVNATCSLAPTGG